MHDGQMLFDSSVTWNQQAWDVDDVIMALLHESRIRQVIVVGIWNGGETRHSDYFPMKPFGLLTGSQQDAVMAAARPNGVSLFKGEAINSDNYLRFLVTELKPFIDRTYSVNSGMEHTFVAGSSMGGLISLYAICEYPEVFGGAACMSTHWPGIFTMEGNPVPDAFFSYMSQHLPDPQTHSIYFDCGDQTLDALYPPLQAKADAVMREKGFTGKSWQTRFFPGKDHSEKSWNERLHIPLTFLLGKE
jgi:enterochelin esterase-like enzyme